MSKTPNLLGRRAVLSGAVGAAAAMHAPTMAQRVMSVPNAPPQAPPQTPPPVTRILARYLVEAKFADLPANVRKEGTRTLLNWVGCAVGGSRHETIDKAVAALAPFSGKAEANVLGRSDRFDSVTAAFLNGASSHVFDYDDTHLKTIIHPAGPVAAAILALAQHRKVTGTAFLNALVLGVETECRIGNAVYPEHYAMGWHITGSTGPFGAAAACGKLLGLDEQQMIHALGIAATQPVGLKIQFGSMTKSFHPARAAQNGMYAALLAQQGFTANVATIEGKDGWGQTLSTRQDWSQITEGLGVRYEAALNSYKPFACGIVSHPAIDAAIQLRTEYHLTGAEIEAAELHCNPLVQSLMGKTDPMVGLEGKFSIYHCVAMGLMQGAAGERQFSDTIVRDPRVMALRKRITLRIDPAVPPDKCDLTLTLKDGRRLSKHIEHAIGSLEAPMTDRMLETKFRDLASGIIDEAGIQRLIDLCWQIETLDDAGRIASAGSV